MLNVVRIWGPSKFGASGGLRSAFLVRCGRGRGIAPSPSGRAASTDSERDASPILGQEARHAAAYQFFFFFHINIYIFFFLKEKAVQPAPDKMTDFKSMFFLVL